MYQTHPISFNYPDKNGASQSAKLYNREHYKKACLVFTKHFKICNTMNVDELSNATHGT